MSETTKYRKKPIVIDAYEFQNRIGEDNRPKWIIVAAQMGVIKFKDKREGPPHLEIEALEGTMIANVGDWIIKGVHGELYPCKPEIFAATYEPVE